MSGPSEHGADSLSSDEAEKRELIKRIKSLELELKKFQNNCEGIIARLDEVDMEADIDEVDMES